MCHFHIVYLKVCLDILQEGEERLEAVVRGNLSIKLIQMLEEISNITSEIHQVHERLQ